MTHILFIHLRITSVNIVGSVPGLGYFFFAERESSSRDNLREALSFLFRVGRLYIFVILFLPPMRNLIDHLFSCQPADAPDFSDALL